MLGTVGGAIGGAYLGDGIQDGTVFGGLTGKKDNDNENLVIRYTDSLIKLIDSGSTQSADAYMTRLSTEAKSAGIDAGIVSAATTAVTAWKTAQDTVNNAKSDEAKKQDAYITANANLSSLKNDAKIALESVKAEAENINSSSGNKNQWLGPTLGAVLTGAAGGFLLNKATRDIQASNLSAAEKAAYEEWMDSVGQHIKCYIGTDEAGEYGDVLSVSME